MTTNFWALITSAIVNLIGNGSFSQFKGFFQSLFDAVIKDKPDPSLIVVGNRRVGTVAGNPPGAAPDEIKELLRNLITDLVTQAFNGRPILSKIILAFVKNVPDAWLDGLWDKIFAAKIAVGELPLAATFVALTKVMAPNPLTCSADDLRECMAEAGMIHESLVFEKPEKVETATEK